MSALNNIEDLGNLPTFEQNFQQLQQPRNFQQFGQNIVVPTISGSVRSPLNLGEQSLGRNFSNTGINIPGRINTPQSPKTNIIPNNQSQGLSVLLPNIQSPQTSNQLQRLPGLMSGINSPSVPKIRAPMIPNLGGVRSPRNQEDLGLRIPRPESPRIQQQMANLTNNIPQTTTFQLPNFQLPATQQFVQPQTTNFQLPQTTNFQLPATQQFVQPQTTNFQLPNIERFVQSPTNQVTHTQINQQPTYSQMGQVGPELSIDPNYTEKSMVVFGNTSRWITNLKNLGGRFNSKLKSGPGWVFSKSNANSRAVFDLVNGANNGTMQPLPVSLVQGQTTTQQVTQPVEQQFSNMNISTPAAKTPTRSSVLPNQPVTLNFPNLFVASDNLQYQVVIYTVPLPHIGQKLTINSSNGMSEFQVVNIKSIHPVDSIEIVGPDNNNYTAKIISGEWKVLNFPEHFIQFH